MSRLAVVAVLALLTGACSDEGDARSAGPTSTDRSSDTSTEVVGQLPPVLEIPNGVTPCRAEELHLVVSADSPRNGQTEISIYNRSGGPCGLAGFLTVVGRDAQGEWHAVATSPNPRAAVDGDRRMGVLDPDMNVVVVVRPSTATDCKAPVASAHYTGLRLVLPGVAGVLESGGFEFDVGGCPLEITAIAGDGGDF